MGLYVYDLMCVSIQCVCVHSMCVDGVYCGIGDSVSCVGVDCMILKERIEPLSTYTQTQQHRR